MSGPALTVVVSCGRKQSGVEYRHFGIIYTTTLSFAAVDISRFEYRPKRRKPCCDTMPYWVLLDAHSRQPTKRARMYVNIYVATTSIARILAIDDALGWGDSSVQL